MSNPAHSGIYGLDPYQISVPVGATNALFINGQSVAGCNIVLIENRSGSTFAIIGTDGSTLSPTALAARYDAGRYSSVLVGLGYAYEGPAMFYVHSQGATLSAQVTYGKSQGT